MSTLERIFHALLFEVLAVSLSILGLIIFTNHDPQILSGTMIVIASIAMAWNFIFNWIFDLFLPGDKDKRTMKLRLVHVIIFEAGLLVLTVPVMAYILTISIVDAFMMDIVVTVFITIYAFIFNWVYDNVRAVIISRKCIPATASL
ncbi:MAG: PACE efflux transporter [Moritella sp.]|uniref:PACE efflux transporter n=1 Tax=Moritella sp. TaxID=78556 RepID=UPI0029ACB4A3|nr:PACE efflux transporter [Moritella sp.]MDX2320875.1 PACE efflux transporter [Moritella sp.]